MSPTFPLRISAFNRGIAWNSKGDFDRAIVDFTGAIQLGPSNAAFYFNRGIAWWSKSDLDQAIASFAAAIILDPKDAEAYFSRGVAWQAKGDFDKAIADYTEAIGLDPEHALAYNNRAKIMVFRPDTIHRNADQAISDATRACELTRWKNASCLATLAAAYNEAGVLESAVMYQEKALGLYEDEKGRQEGRELLAIYQAKRPSRQDSVPSSATAPMDGSTIGFAFLVTAVLVAILLVGLLFYIGARVNTNRDQRQAGGVSDWEHDPIPDTAPPKAPLPKPVNVVPVS